MQLSSSLLFCVAFFVRPRIAFGPLSFISPYSPLPAFGPRAKFIAGIFVKEIWTWRLRTLAISSFVTVVSEISQRFLEVGVWRRWSWDVVGFILFTLLIEL